ncbi:hypothetical protein HGRIS_002355 [Hohenbuehelia grisea]|uniref:YCII-related domain-containing protein n=1 Tax=Hohenbuehelia grisea TaxID=104357 RepID=A0ABR3JLM1_9AGAR
MAEPTLQKFFVYAPDYTDEGTFQRRMSVRPKHLEKIAELKNAGKIRVGGVLLSPESVETADAEKKIIGSTLICEYENIGQVREMIESDIYWSSNIWDKERLVILPFVPAIPTPFP